MHYDQLDIQQEISIYQKVSSKNQIPFHEFLYKNFDMTLHKELPELEFEIKFSINKNRVNCSALEILTEFESLFSTDRKYFVDGINIETNMNPHFFVVNDIEYSIFKYNEKVLLKLKNHNIFYKNEIPLYINKKSFIYETQPILDFIQEKEINYYGEIVKKRAKSFLIDKETGQIYSCAATICNEISSRPIIQKQLEIEYHGSLMEGETNHSISTALLLLAEHIYNISKSLYQYSTERKFDLLDQKPKK